MRIPNFDCESNNEVIQLYPFMPSQVFRMLICGPSGSGKTNTLIYLLQKPLICYDQLYVYAKNLQQEKYQMLKNWAESIEEEIGHKFTHFSDNEIIPVTDICVNDCVKLVIFDDYLVERNQNEINNYFIQGRNRKCCVIYVSQRYFGTPKEIRSNLSHLCIFKQSSKTDKNLILGDHCIPQQDYDEATSDPFSFLYVDNFKNTNNKNFDEKLTWGRG